MNYNAYYAVIAVLVIAMSFSIIAARRSNKAYKEKIERRDKALEACALTPGEPVKPMTMHQQGEAIEFINLDGSRGTISADGNMTLFDSGNTLRVRLSSKQTNSGRDKVLAELNRRTEHWAVKRKSLNLTNKRQLLIIRELKQIVDADQFSEICRSINKMDPADVLKKAAGK